MQRGPAGWHLSAGGTQPAPLRTPGPVGRLSPAAATRPSLLPHSALLRPSGLHVQRKRSRGVIVPPWTGFVNPAAPTPLPTAGNRSRRLISGTETPPPPF